MKKKGIRNRIGILMGMLFLIPALTFAQEKLKMEVGYNVSSPTGSFKNDFISNTSFTGMSAQVSYAVSQKFSVGISSGYQQYYQKYPRQLYKLENNQTISAVVSNNMELIPLLISGTYYPMGTVKAVNPYFRGAAGVNLVNYQQYVGEFGGTDVSVPLAFQGGAGLQIPFGKQKRNGIVIGANYNHVAYDKNSLNNLNSLNYHAGIIFPIK